MADCTELAVTNSEPGLREQLDAAEAERLAEVKAAMSEEELQSIIDMTNAEEEEDDASAYVAALQAVTTESLPEEMRFYDVSDETGADGVDCHFKADVITADFIKAVKDKGYEFHVWTVDNLDQSLLAFERGAQTVTTNCAKKQLDEYKAR